jgi:signal transduction histidine kinase
MRDLRDFSRPDLPARSLADVNQALDSTANIVWAMMTHKVDLEKQYGVLPEIDAYPMQLKQVFMNLLLNGYQAIEARDDENPGVIRVETERDADEIVIRIGDSGVGIDPAVQARIFEPFFTTKPVGAGTGLGLSTSYAIIERHGGRIGVTSVVGHGTTFEVRLPIREPKHDSPGADQS